MALDAPASAAPAPPARLAPFALMWSGQFVSLVGSALTRFALGVWVFEATGSKTLFTLIAFSAALPGLAFAPFAGVLVDRHDRRRLMMMADSVTGVGAAVLAVLYATGALALPHIYAFVALSSLADGVQWPSFAASTTLMVPKKHLARVAGLTQFGQALAGVLAPIPGALLIASFGLGSVLMVEVATFLVAVTTLSFVVVPRPPPSAEGRAGRGSMWREAGYGWTYLRERPGLLGLLGFFAAVNLVLGVGAVMVTPMVLSFATVTELGGVTTASAAGILLGGLVMGVSGGLRSRIHGALLPALAVGVFLSLVGFKASALWVGAMLFATTFWAPVINASSQAIWQTKVPADVQGRVFSVRRLVAQATLPLGFLASGPLVDFVFTPLAAEGGVLDPTLDLVFGARPGREMALLYLVLGAVPIAATLWAYSRPAIRGLETDLPDAIP